MISVNSSYAKAALLTEKRAHIQIPPAAIAVLRALEGAGYEAWLVGGFVRDALMGHPADDVDIASNAHWTQARDAFVAAGFAVHETGAAHGTVTAVVHGTPIEVTTYRQDGAYSDGRHPDHVVFVGNIIDDLARRDFTVNAVAYHPERGMCDPYHGVDDMQRGIIRTVGNPVARFSEDALRILRAARFQSQLGFSIEEETAHAMVAQRGSLVNVAAERQVRELDRLLCGEHTRDAIMGNIDVLGTIIPELLPLRGFDQHTPYHCYDILEHTAYVVQYVNPTPLLRWAALLHDIGKPAMFFVDGQGIGHFKGHARVSGDITRDIMRRLKMRPRFARHVEMLVRQHDDRVEPSEKAVKRRLAKLEYDPDLMRALCNLKRADALAHSPDYRTPRVERSATVLSLLDKILEEEQAFKLSDLAINGSDVIAAGIQPGPEVGKILQQLLDAVIEENLPNTRDSLIARIVSPAR